METARRRTADGMVKLNLPALIRNILLADCGVTQEHAQRIVSHIERSILGADEIRLNSDTLLLAETLARTDGGDGAGEEAMANAADACLTRCGF